MNFGAEFDDEIFEKPKLKNCELEPVRRGAKICEPKWFLENNLCYTDREDQLKCLKYKADYLYYTKKYGDSCATYHEYMNLLPDSNITARRECMENLSRSYLHQDNLDKALEWALKMHEASVSADHRLCSWNLLATICHRLRKYEEELEALHSCVAMHKSFPDFWFRLAYCYSGLFRLDLPGCNQLSTNTSNSSYCCSFKYRTRAALNSPSSSSDSKEVQSRHQSSHQIESDNELSSSSDGCRDQNPQIDETVPKCEMCDFGSQMISACLIRTRILLSNSERSPSIQLKSAHINETITECLKHLEVEQLFIEEASKLLRLEMYNNHVQNAREGTPAESTKVDEQELVEKTNAIKI